MLPVERHSISFSTRSRTHYQENGADQRPVLARDTWTNTVHLHGADYQRCAAPADCDPSGTKIDTRLGLPADPDVDGTDDIDESSASQSAPAPTIDKQIRNASAAPVSCNTGTYTDGPAGPYGPGDRICYRLRVELPRRARHRHADRDRLPAAGHRVRELLADRREQRHDPRLRRRARPRADLDPRRRLRRRQRRRHERPGLRGAPVRAGGRPDRAAVRRRQGQPDEVLARQQRRRELPAARPGRVHLGGAAAHAHRGRPRHREPARRRQRPGRRRRYRAERRRGHDPRRRDQPGRAQRAERDRLGAPAHGSRQPDDRLPRRARTSPTAASAPAA